MGKKIEVSGIIPAMLTPFTDTGEVDTEGLRETVNHLISNGVSQIMCLGSTGEATALTKNERIAIIEETVRTANGRVPVMAGTGAPTTRDVMEQTREAKNAGADLAMIVTPFYEIPNQEGLYRHYATIAETVDLPIVLYNIPPHTNVEIGLSTLEKLVEIDNIVALKESSGNLAYFAEAMLRVGSKMPILTGGDDISLPCFAMGCHGAILALANIAPGDLVSLYQAVRDRDMAKAAELYYRLLPIARAISTAENFPAPLKEAVNQLGRPAGPARSPIMPVNAAEKETIRQALKTANLL